jgi:hypothetical protein
MIPALKGRKTEVRRLKFPYNRYCIILTTNKLGSANSLDYVFEIKTY